MLQQRARNATNRNSLRFENSQQRNRPNSQMTTQNFQSDINKSFK